MRALAADNRRHAAQAQALALDNQRKAVAAKALADRARREAALARELAAFDPSLAYSYAADDSYAVVRAHIFLTAPPGSVVTADCPGCGIVWDKPLALSTTTIFVTPIISVPYEGSLTLLVTQRNIGRYFKFKAGAYEPINATRLTQRDSERCRPPGSRVRTADVPARCPPPGRSKAPPAVGG